MVKVSDEAELLWAAYRKCRDEEAMTALLRHYEDWAKAVARAIAVKRTLYTISLEEAEAEGLLTLWRCLERYEPDNKRKAAFMSFAQHRIAGAVLDYVRTVENRSRTLIKTGKAPKIFSIDAPLHSQYGADEAQDDDSYLATLAAEDHGSSSAIRDEDWEALFTGLPMRERLIADLHFKREWPVPRIAAKVGYSEASIWLILRDKIRPHLLAAGRMLGLWQDVPAAHLSPRRRFRCCP